MWTYNYSDELYHYGVLGMKWGQHKSNPYLTSISDARSRVKNTKSAYKTAFKQYTKDAKYSYKYANRHPLSKHFGAHKKEADKRFDKASNSLASANKAKTDYNAAKNAYKVEKDNYRSKVVSDYKKKFNSALEKTSNIANKKWHELDERHKALGKNEVERMLKDKKVERVSKDNSKAFNEVSRMSDVKKR